MVPPARRTERSICVIAQLTEGEKSGCQTCDGVFANHRTPSTRYSLALLDIVLSRPELSWKDPSPENLERVRQHIERHLRKQAAEPNAGKNGRPERGMFQPSLQEVFRQPAGPLH